MTIFEGTVLISITLIASVATNCPKGQFQPQQNMSCRACSPCGSGQIVIKECFNFNDTECGCRKNEYLDTRHQICKGCTQASPGQIYIKVCSQFADSIIENCQKGTFTNDSKKCYICSTCNANIKEPCTTSKDAVCKKHERKKDDHTKEVLVGVFVPILCIVVIAFLVYLFYRKRAGTDLNENVTATANTSMSSLANVENGRSNVYVERPSVRVSYNRVNSRSSNISSITNPLSPDNEGAIAVVSQENASSGGSIKWKTIELNELDYNTRRELSLYLKPEGHIKNWKNVACDLGITHRDILNLENNVKPVMDMLETYSTKKGASIPGLYEAIKRNGRNDALTLFDQFKM